MEVLPGLRDGHKVPKCEKYKRESALYTSVDRVANALENFESIVVLAYVNKI